MTTGKVPYKEIAKKYDVSVDALKRHFKNHMVRHLTPVVTHYDEKTGESFMHVWIDGESCMLPLKKMIQELKKSRMTVCITDDELEKGREHTAKVKAHYRKMGDLKEFKHQIKKLIHDYPGFQPVI